MRVVLGIVVILLVVSVGMLVSDWLQPDVFLVEAWTTQDISLENITMVEVKNPDYPVFYTDSNGLIVLPRDHGGFNFYAPDGWEHTEQEEIRIWKDGTYKLIIRLKVEPISNNLSNPQY